MSDFWFEDEDNKKFYFLTGVIVIGVFFLQAFVLNQEVFTSLISNFPDLSEYSIIRILIYGIFMLLFTVLIFGIFFVLFVIGWPLVWFAAAIDMAFLVLGVDLPPAVTNNIFLGFIIISAPFINYYLFLVDKSLTPVQDFLDESFQFKIFNLAKAFYLVLFGCSVIIAGLGLYQHVVREWPMMLRGEIDEPSFQYGSIFYLILMIIGILVLFVGIIMLYEARSELTEGLQQSFQQQFGNIDPITGIALLGAGILLVPLGIILMIAGLIMILPYLALFVLGMVLLLVINSHSHNSKSLVVNAQRGELLSRIRIIIVLLGGMLGGFKVILSLVFTGDFFFISIGINVIGLITGSVLAYDVIQNVFPESVENHFAEIPYLADLLLKAIIIIMLIITPCFINVAISDCLGSLASFFLLNNYEK